MGTVRSTRTLLSTSKSSCLGDPWVAYELVPCYRAIRKLLKHDMNTYGDGSTDLGETIGVGGMPTETVQQVERFIDSSNDQGAPLAPESSSEPVASGSGLGGITPAVVATGHEDD